MALIEKSRRDRIGTLRRVHETKVEISKAAEKKWKADVKAAVEAGQKAPEMPPEAQPVGEFVPPRLFISNATIERLAVLLQARPQGIAMVIDELAGLFKNMGRYSNGSTRSFG